MIRKLRDKLVEICNETEDLLFQFHLTKWDTDFLRFYQSQTNYNISKSSLTLSVSIHKGKKSYAFSLVEPTEEKLRDKIEEVKGFIDHLPDDPDFVSIQDNLEKTAEIEKKDNRKEVTLDRKIEILNHIADAVAPLNFKLYGTFICNYRTLYIVNSNGLNKREISSPIYFEAKAVDQETEVTVLETFGGEDFSLFDLDDFTKKLKNKCGSGKLERSDLPAGEYDVILAPRCIGEFWQYLMGSVSARTLDNKTSYFEGKLNEKVFPENISITDDPSHPEMIQYDYTHSGYPYENLKIIENGVFRNYMVDHYYANKLNMKETGSEASALVMSPGKDDLKDMIKSIEKGIFISSLHYMNFINHKETSLTGLTRDGTFLIENGKITKVINNLRFTEKIARIIENITMIEKIAVTVPFSHNYGHFGIESCHMPHVKVKNFKITSSTGTI